MARFAEAKFTVRAVNKTQKAFAQINQGVDNMDRRFSKMGRGLQRIGGLMATAFVGRQVVDTITKFEKLEASLRTITGSAEKAAVAFGFIQDFAATTPFQLEEVTDAFIKLKALGLTPSAEALTSYGNTATAMGKSLNQMIEAVADAATGEFERLKEFGIKSKSQGDQVTFTFQGISTTVGKNAAEIEAYLQSIGNVQFAGAMQEQSKTLNVALSNMGDAFSKLVKAIGDAGLTDILTGIANSIKWLAEKITNSIEPFKLGFKAIIAEVIKFGRLFIAVFEGVGDAFNAFGDAISARFEALGKDLAAFIENPLGGVSFENTRAALETGLLDAMGNAFDKALAEAREFNAAIDAEIGAAADKIVKANAKKAQSLGDLFKKPEGKTDTTSPAGNANKKLEKDSKETTSQIEKDFESLGDSIESKLVDSLDIVGGKFTGFKDLAKGILSDINQTLLKTAMKDLGIGGQGGLIGGLMSSLGGAFGGGGDGSGIGGLISTAASMFGGFFADGGKLKPGQFGVVGERGPELAFAGSSPLNIMPNGTGAAPVTVNMNIQTPDVRSFNQSQSQIAADMARSIDRAKRNL
ncbi:tape measure protein [Rickettsiales bacterium]|nr:tape measure protein [Rickettsiales bacterium]